MRRGNESGSALAASLMLIFTGSLMVMLVLSLSRYGVTTVPAHTELQKSYYVNELVAYLLQYLVSAERRINPNANLLDTDYSDGERFLPDGVEHTFDYHGKLVTFSLVDTRSGIDLSSRAYSYTISALKRYSETDTEFTSALDRLKAILDDYNDSDDLTSSDGRESTEYDTASAAPLPRNGAMLYREELFYVPELLALVKPDRDGRLSGIRLITSAGYVSGYTTSLFNSSDLEIKSRLSLDDAQLSELRAALDEYRRDPSTKLSDLMSEELRLKVNGGSFQNTPSGYYTVRVSSGEKRPSSTLVFSFQASGVNGPSDGVVKYLEWLSL